jgi:hypothetical protein
MGKLNKKIVIRVTRKQLEHIVSETIKQKKEYKPSGTKGIKRTTNK